MRGFQSLVRAKRVGDGKSWLCCTLMTAVILTYSQHRWYGPYALQMKQLKAAAAGKKSKSSKDKSEAGKEGAKDAKDKVERPLAVPQVPGQVAASSSAAEPGNKNKK